MKSKSNILEIIPILLIIIIVFLKIFDSKLISNFGNIPVLVLDAIIWITLIVFFVIDCIRFQTWRKAIPKSLILVGIVAVSIIICTMFFISFVGDLSVYVDQNYNIGKGNWLSYFGAVFGAGITVAGAFVVTHFQNRSENDKKINANSVLLLNDLKYICNRIDKYIDNIKQNTNNDDFYRIRYLDISENWRELVSILYQNKVLDNVDVSVLYNFFTDIAFITEKYDELRELNINELNLEAQQKENLRKKKKQIKEDINNKYKEIYSDKVRKIIEKLDNGLITDQSLHTNIVRDGVEAVAKKKIVNDSIKIKITELTAFLKKILIHTFKDLLVLNLILISFIIFCFFTLKDSDSGNYIAEILGMIITINIIDFLNEQRTIKKERNKYDIELITVNILCNDVERIIKELLGVDSINYFSNINQIQPILNDDGFWECEISIEWRLGFLRGERKQIYEYLVKHLDKEIKKIFIRFSNYIDSELFTILSTIQISTEEDMYGDIYVGNKDYFKFGPSQILMLIRNVISLRQYVNKYLHKSI